MVKVRGSARCAEKKREAAMRHRDRCDSQHWHWTLRRFRMRLICGMNTPIICELHLDKQISMDLVTDCKKRRNLIIYSYEILSEIISIKYSINIKSKIILFFLIFRKVKFFVILTEHLKLFHLPLNSYYQILFSEW